MSRHARTRQPAVATPEPRKPTATVRRGHRSHTAPPGKTPAYELVDEVWIVEVDQGQALESPDQDHDWGDPAERHRFDNFYARFVKS